MDQNVNNIVKKFIEKKSLFLVLVVFLLFVVSAIVLFGDFSSKAVKYRKQNEEKLKKVARIAEYEKSNKEIKDFIFSLPESFDAEKIANQVAEYASTNHINVLRTSSKDVQVYDKYSIIGIRVSFIARNFHDLVSFFRAIENSPYYFKIESWLGKTVNSGDGSIESEVNIIAYQIKI